MDTVTDTAFQLNQHIDLIKFQTIFTVFSLLFFTVRGSVVVFLEP